MLFTVRRTHTRLSVWTGDFDILTYHLLICKQNFYKHVILLRNLKKSYVKKPLLVVIAKWMK